MTIKIPAIIDSTVIEALISKLHQSSSGKIDIEFPLEFTANGFGVLPAICQFFITWKRSLKSEKLVIIHDGSLTENAQLKHTIVKHYLFFISIIAWENEIVDHTGKDLKSIIRVLNRELMDYVWRNETSKMTIDDSVIIPCVDHLPKEIGLPPILYSNGTLRGEDDFENVSDILIQLATRKHDLLGEYLDKIKYGLNKILYESFDNTNNWAVQSYTGRILNPSVRSIYGKFHEGSIQEMSSLENSASLKKYFSRLKLKRPLGVEYRNAFLEISIFDSGSGLVQVFSRQPIQSLSLKDEYKYLLNCLEKHKTSHTAVTTAYARGAGLHRIMTALNAVNAYLLVRTGRMFLYRDFLNHEFHNKTYNTYNYSLLDVDNQSAMPTERPFAEGTLISIIIPRLFVQ